MGCDIHGVVEVQEYEDSWWHKGPVGFLTTRDYTAFDVLFGVRSSGSANLSSGLFADRGVPDDCSIRVDERLEDYREKGLIGAVDCHSLSYATLGELRSVDWEKSASPGRNLLVEIDEEGVPQRTWATPDDLTPAQEVKLFDHGDAIEYDLGTRTVRLVDDDILLRTTITNEWEWFIFAYLESMAEYPRIENPGEEVRIVVWFDN